MSNSLIRIYVTAGGDEIEPEDREWCIGVSDDCARTACGDATDDLCEYEQKETKRGGVTCKKCLKTIKALKKYKF